jgi:hypothetical protein
MRTELLLQRIESVKTLLLLFIIGLLASGQSYAQLDVVTSQVVVTQDGAVIEGKHFKGFLDKQALVIRANNVTVKGCLFEDCTWAVAIQGQRDGITITGNRFENVGTAVSAIEGYIFNSKINYNEGVGIGIYNILDAKIYPDRDHGYWSSNFIMLINANQVEVNYNIVDNKDLDTQYLEDLVNFYSEPHGGVAECSNVMVKGNRFRGTDNLCNISATGGGIVFDCVGENDSIVDNYMIRMSGYGAAFTGVHNSAMLDNYTYYPSDHTKNYNSHPHFGIGGSGGGSYAFGNTDYNREADCSTIHDNYLIRCHAYSIDYGVNTSATDCGSNAGSGGVWNLYERCSSNPFIKIDNDLRTTDPHWDSLLPDDMFANLPYQYFSGSSDEEPPLAPQNLLAESNSAYSVVLDWDDNTDDDLRGYNVKRSTTSGGAYTLIATKVAESEYHDKGLSPLTSYYYVITAVDYSNNESEVSNEASVTTSDAPEMPAPNSFYDFDEGSGTDVADKGEANNDGTLVGTDISWTIGGIVSSSDENQGCIEIKGDPYSGRAYVEIPFASFHNSDNYTYSAWVKYTNSTNAWGYLFWQNGDYSDSESPTRHVDMWWNPHDKVLASVVHDNTGAEVRVVPASQSVDMYDGNWHCAAITLENNTTIKIWEDGILIKEVTSPNPLAYTNNNDLWIGCKPESVAATGNVTKMIGLVDRVRIFDSALTADQIAALYYSEIPADDIPTSINRSKESLFSLKQNRPNPFRSETTIGFNLQYSGHVRLQIIDITGAVVETVVDRDMQAGNYETKWNSNVKGMYFYQLTFSTSTGVFQDTKKMILAK